MNKQQVLLTNSDVNNLANEFLKRFENIHNNFFQDRSRLSVFKVYGVPRGGIPAAYALLSAAGSRFNFVVTDKPQEADFFFDDIIDSGETLKRYCDLYPGVPFFALIDKTDMDREDKWKDKWFVFPWEGDSNSSIEDNIRRIIQFTGDDPAREGLIDTPKRVAKALEHWFSGYKYSKEDITALMKTFEDGSEGCDEMVTRRNIPVYSKCEHHMADIWGFVTVAYIPKDKVVGLSKMDRIVDIFGRRLQVQERLTNQIADAMWDNLNPIGVGVQVVARHMCIESRGVCNANSETITTALRGTMKQQASTRQEFLLACK